MPETLPVHLLLPLIASILFVCGLMLIKKASAEGVRPWTVTLVANLWAAVVFSALLAFGGTNQPLAMIWQPMLIAILYILGQVFTFLALSFGDVSVAAPAFSIKVVLVAFFLTTLAGQRLPILVWVAAAMAAIGITLVQRGGSGSHGSRIGRSVTFALLAATTFALFDVIVQSWAPAWGAGRLLPLTFWFAAMLSVVFVPWSDSLAKLPLGTLSPLLIGTLCVALQAVCIVFTLAQFGDAARVNIVYSLRGLWGVVLAFAFSRILRSGEAHLSLRFFLSRLVGAGLLTAAVLLAIASGS